MSRLDEAIMHINGPESRYLPLLKVSGHHDAVVLADRKHDLRKKKKKKDSLFA